jgi:hypothetical protein
MHIARKATRTVATLLNLTTIRIEDSVHEVCLATGVLLDQQDLIRTHTETPVSQTLEALGVQQARGKAPSPIKDHEIISRAMHFGERYLHIGIIDDRKPVHGLADGF